MRTAALALLLACVATAAPKRPRVVLLLTKTPPSSKKKFEKAVARAYGELDKAEISMVLWQLRSGQRTAIVDLIRESPLLERIFSSHRLVSALLDTASAGDGKLTLAEFDDFVTETVSVE